MNCAGCGCANPEGAAFCEHCAMQLQPGAVAASPADVESRSAAAAPGPADPEADHGCPGPANAAYACAVCGCILGAVDQQCARCKTPRGMRVDPSAPLPGSYMPVAGIPGGMANTSGMHGSVPEELRVGWNWGAFGFGWIWGLPHRCYVTVLDLAILPLMLVPPIGLIVALGLRMWYALRGDEWAWQDRRFESLEHYRSVQRVWTRWVLAAYVGCGVVSALVLAMMVAALQGRSGALTQ
jgi:hypothetical protein